MKAILQGAAALSILVFAAMADGIMAHGIRAFAVTACVWLAAAGALVMLGRAFE